MLFNPIILKFGGSSMSQISQVAQICLDHLKKNQRLIVVVSAQQGITEQLIKQAQSYNNSSSLNLSVKREMDMLISTGERVSMSLLAIELLSKGVSCKSLTGSQTGIITSNEFGNADIINIRSKRLLNELNSHQVIIVAGFQGMSLEKEITTLGRGGSDLSAIALGHYLNSSEVILYSDINGLYDCNPKQYKKAQLIPQCSREFAYACSLMGAKLIHEKAAFYAYKNSINYRLKSTFEPHLTGTQINAEKNFKNTYESDSYKNPSTKPWKHKKNPSLNSFKLNYQNKELTLTGF